MNLDLFCTFIKAKGQSIVENFFQVMKYDLDMKKKKKKPEGADAGRKRLTWRTEKGKMMNSVARQMGTMREVGAKQWVLVLIILTKIIKDSASELLGIRLL